MNSIKELQKNFIFILIFVTLHVIFQLFSASIIILSFFITKYSLLVKYNGENLKFISLHENFIKVVL